MKRQRHSDEQVLRKLKEAETALLAGATIFDVCHELSVSEATYHRWRKKHAGAVAGASRHGGGKDDVSKRLKEMEKENKRLKQLVGQLMLDNTLLKDALESKRRR